jgi:SpoVK/Ycf46/Vps4 family AAA+-type ATPase
LNKRSNNTGSFENLVKTSENFIKTKEDLVVSTRISLTGIVNLVVNYEDPALVNEFLSSCFKSKHLYHNTTEIDAIELQQGSPGKNNAAKYIDQLIYGSYKTEETPEGIPVFVTNPQTGKRMREADGFLTRAEIKSGDFEDKLLVLRNIDKSLDFCSEGDGEIDPRNLWIFENFRNPMVKKGCRLLLVTNEKLKLPFSIRTVEINPVNEHEANHIIDSFHKRYINAGYEINITQGQREQIIRKISGLTYTDAGDAIVSSLSKSEKPKGSKKIDMIHALKMLRKQINTRFLENGQGLTALEARSWDDYICPESSNFTYDVKKLLRDFDEVEELKKEEEKAVKNNKEDLSILHTIDAIQTRMPHIIVLYGKGGVGKSAFPIHLAGLLDIDVWDFNINATHSKWIGEGSKQMREALDKITQSSHIIVRIDEYDRAMGATDESGSGMHEAHKQVESEFMNWLQNCQEENIFTKRNIFLVLTTNHKENITGPLLRSGRADLVIDIDNFDSKSMKTTFLTSAKRMYNRGVNVIGFSSHEDLHKEIEKLNLDQLSELATAKGFTVRDVESLIQEMSAHDYYYKKYNEGIEWSNDSFVEVLEKSIGSIRENGTGELVLGDRDILMAQTKGKDLSEEELHKQEVFEFFKESVFDPDVVKGFIEI